MEKALEFYRDLLGLEVMMDMELNGAPAIEAIFGIENIKMRYVLFDGIGAKLNLLEFKSPRGEGLAEKMRPYDHGIHHIALSVDDIDAAYQELGAKGVEFISPPQDTGIARANAIRGPDGVVVELFELPVD
jgi:catechol 2,3-dioxygenase-like lactoylglutathione lyase family enzyme